MQPIQAPKSIFGSSMTSTTVSEETQATDFGVQQKVDASEHIYAAIDNSFQFGINFAENMTNLEVKRQADVLQKKKEAARELEAQKRQKEMDERERVRLEKAEQREADQEARDIERLQMAREAAKREQMQFEAASKSAGEEPTQSGFIGATIGEASAQNPLTKQGKEALAAEEAWVMFNRNKLNLTGDEYLRSLWTGDLSNLIDKYYRPRSVAPPVGVTP
jgi:hypothetical protein